MLPVYTELFCRSNFSFQHGASHPKELVSTAYKLGYRAIAITDECSLAGSLRAHTYYRELLSEKKSLLLRATCGLLSVPLLNRKKLPYSARAI